MYVNCPICDRQVRERDINSHIDSNCHDHVATSVDEPQPAVSSFFQKHTPAKALLPVKLEKEQNDDASTTPKSPPDSPPQALVKSEAAKALKQEAPDDTPLAGRTNGPAKRAREGHSSAGNDTPTYNPDSPPPPPAKKRDKRSSLQKAAPLAERMRPRNLDDVCGQELVGPNGVLRGLIEQDRVPSMILWGGPGTGKTTIARVIASSVGSRFVEINSTSTGVAECKKLFSEARNELSLSDRKTIIFCDEIHRFSKSQQDVFLGPVEAGIVTLIGATTENPSFKVITPLLSRCRTFPLSKLTEQDIVTILERALAAENITPPLLDASMLSYLAAFADGDARTALNLLELAIDLSTRPNNPTTTQSDLKSALTRTFVYDRAGDSHYDTISALHKSIRGSDPDAALFYLARMLIAGEDPLFIARRLVVCSSEDVGLADNSMLPLAVATYTAVEKIGMPEARIPLAHCVVALSQAPKSVRAYRGLNAAWAAIEGEQGVGGLPVPLHLRNAPTRLMKELNYGKEYKYNPDYWDGKVKQEYLPEKLRGRKFLPDMDLGKEVDPDLDDEYAL
ncbi:putative AAA family ATPase [Lineolata rhizophorae]|uniref:Putative AAA family ATPase n=1 Tax=Lineolata rhizophorae TaxID=578093 RepID=A0A6A6NQF1_9PEZI|nr:putative AAA family ATPase [Lineolata rhizophorae]